MTLVLAAIAALLLDALLGEPRRLHPLIGFGALARGIEHRLHAARRFAGLLAWVIAVLPITGLAAWLTWRAASHSLLVWALWSVLVLYLCVGHRSLREHALPVAKALRDGRVYDARQAVGRMVSRDVHVLDASQVAGAATESVLENGNDAVFGTLFWFLLLGAPGAVLYRLANTLDAMWGYRTPRYERFGWAAARIDDALNFLPARLTALSYAVFGRSARALQCWRAQAPAWDSPNAGPVMAAGAGALGVRLGGAAPYHGQWETRPTLGEGDAPDADSIERALGLVLRSVILWLGVALLIAAAWEWAGA